MDGLRGHAAFADTPPAWAGMVTGTAATAAEASRTAGRHTETQEVLIVAVTEVLGRARHKDRIDKIDKIDPDRATVHVKESIRYHRLQEPSGSKGGSVGVVVRELHPVPQINMDVR